MNDNPHYIYAQYKNAPIITAIINDNAQAFDLENINQQFLTNAFDLDTCQGVWLDVWGKKIGLNRVFRIPYIYDCFGFDGNGAGFDQLPFCHPELTTEYRMDDETYRLALKTRFLANFSANSPHDYNMLLHFFFDNFLENKNFYPVIPVPMWMYFKFPAPLKVWQKQLLLDGNMIPFPAGVCVRIIENESDCFGFDGNGTGFDQINFFEGSE